MRRTPGFRTVPFSVQRRMAAASAAVAAERNTTHRVAEYPWMDAFRRGRRLVLLDEITVAGPPSEWR